VVHVTENGVEVLDLARLDSLVEEIGDRELVQQAVQAFLDEVPDRLAAIRVALAGTDPEELRSAAHALGSPASMLGATAVATRARALQNAATEGRDADARALADEVAQATAETERAMRAYLATPA
jgi:two-component system, sensor histidine kinase and response regulator